MNYGMVAILLLAVIIFTVTVTALMFYVRHWASRQTQQVSMGQFTEGRYVKRYIPPDLRQKYDQQRALLTQRTTIAPRSVARIFNVIIVGLLLTVVGAALAFNRYKLLAPIDLTKAEISNLRPVEASWSALPEPGLPGMMQRVNLLRRRGAALIISPSDKGKVINGQRITLMAQNHWQQFFDHWGVSYHVCDWTKITACLGGRIGVVLPGGWKLNELENALAAGGSLILYGPPSSVLLEHKPLQWQGLSFEPFSNESEPRYLAVRGDQVMTLGLDAGLTLQVDRAFSGYRVFSEAPQAIGINTESSMGDVIDTRIYAKRIGKGRMVWMDYAPDENSQPSEINVRNLEAVNAVVFRYLLGEGYSSWAMWPDGKRFAGAIAEDSEDKFPYAEGVVQMASAHRFPITWFMLSNEAQLNRSLAERMAEVGEVACHGDSHADFPLGSLQTQTERMARCAKVVATITGHTPKGFRPPEEKFNEDTINAVASNDMGYYMAENDMDRMVPKIYREDGGSRELVSLPRMGSDDYAMWHTLKLNGEQSLHLADKELAWISNVGGFLPFSFHTQYMGNQENMNVVEHYGLRFKEPDCYFETTGEIAAWWRVRTKLMRGEPVSEAELTKYHPVRLKVNSQGKLSREEVETITASTGTTSRK